MEKIKVLNDKSGKIIGFIGLVRLYDITVYVDTQTGEGYDKVISKMERYITKLSYKYNLSNLGFGIDDTKQHIIMRILEGIPKYDPSKNTALSTFLHMRVERRLINEIRNSNTEIKNPTVLRTSLYSIGCPCGRKFMIAICGDESIKNKKCFGCSKKLKFARILLVNVPPESINIMQGSIYNNISSDDLISNATGDIPLVYGEKKIFDKEVIFEADFMKWFSNEDQDTKELINLVCFKDYSIKDAAKRLGMSHTGVSIKLKRLGRKKIVRDTFGR